MAGTRAMNGEARKATRAMSSMAARHPGSPAAARAPAASREAMADPLVGDHRPGQPDHDQGHHDGGEGDGVDAEHQAVVVTEQRQTGQCGADHPPEVELGRRQGHRAEEILFGDQVGHHGLEGREPDGPRGPAQEGQHHQHPRRIVSGAGQHGQHGGEGHLGQGGDDEPAPPVEAVGQRAAQRGQQPDGDEGGGGHQTGPPRLVGAGEHQHPEGHRLHPRPDVGDERRRPDECEVPRSERAQRGQGHRSRLPAVRCGQAGAPPPSAPERGYSSPLCLRRGRRANHQMLAMVARTPNAAAGLAILRERSDMGLTLPADGGLGTTGAARWAGRPPALRWRPVPSPGRRPGRNLRRPAEPRRPRHPGGGRSGRATPASTSWPGPAAP